MTLSTKQPVRWSLEICNLHTTYRYALMMAGLMCCL